jgi:hypothetical protein
VTKGSVVTDAVKRIGRPLRAGTNLVAAREAILAGCSPYEAARRSGVSMYMYYRLRSDLREPLPRSTLEIKETV